MEIAMIKSSSPSPLGAWLRRARMGVVLPGLVLGAMVGCGGSSSSSVPTITSFTPSSDSASSNSPSSVQVTVTGTGFSTSITSVTIGGVSVTNGSVVSSTELTFYPGDSGSTGPIVMKVSGGTAESATNFTYVPY